MDTGMRFRINSPEVVSETFGGEVVAIHFGSGNYYSLTGTASEILALLDNGSTASEITEHLALRYSGQSSAIATEVDGFLTALLEEGLIVAREPRETTMRSQIETPKEPLPAMKASFQAPRLEKFGDMQDLLLLDPIHDVDEVGWPRALPETRSAG